MTKLKILPANPFSTMESTVLYCNKYVDNIHFTFSGQLHASCLWASTIQTRDRVVRIILLSRCARRV